MAGSNFNLLTLCVLTAINVESGYIKRNRKRCDVILEIIVLSYFRVLKIIFYLPFLFYSHFHVFVKYRVSIMKKITFFFLNKYIYKNKLQRCDKYSFVYGVVMEMGLMEATYATIISGSMNAIFNKRR